MVFLASPVCFHFLLTLLNLYLDLNLVSLLLLNLYLVLLLFLPVYFPLALVLKLSRLLRRRDMIMAQMARGLYYYPRAVPLYHSASGDYLFMGRVDLDNPLLPLHFLHELHRRHTSHNRFISHLPIPNCHYRFFLLA